MSDEPAEWPYLRASFYPAGGGIQSRFPTRLGAGTPAVIIDGRRPDIRSHTPARWPMDILRTADPELWQAIHDEGRRQQDGLELIASENYTSPAVLQAQGSVLTNKYAEGYPGRRYYGGCEHVDVAERLAIDRAVRL